MFVIGGKSMNDSKTSEVSSDLEKLLSLNKEELEKIFSQLSISEIGDLLNKLNGVEKND